MSTEHVISVVGEADLEDLLPLLRGYCDFYEVAPSDDALLAVSRALIADPEREGLQLIGREPDGKAVGFATLYWTWQTLNAARLGVMNDLFVAEEARGSGLADRLIAACRERSADPRRARARLADRQGQLPGAEGLRPHRRLQVRVAGLLSAGRMRVVKPSQVDRDVPRGVVGGAEISQATTGAVNIYMGLFRVPPAARSRPHYHEGCESAVYMLSGALEVRWGDQLEETVTIGPGDMVYVPPRETHILVNHSDSEPAEYIVARDSPTEDSVEVPWAES